MPAAVTPSGVRDGDPAALAGLCDARGPSVLAYCRHVAGAATAGEAAADAFASFRRGVIATKDLTDLNPEALLINATRTAAARRAPRAQLGVCAVVPLLLAARADKTISASDLEVLEQHLASCWACRAPVARAKAAERAYRDPPDRLVDPALVATMIAAMAAAAPARGAATAVNGDGHGPAAAGDEATTELPAPAVRTSVAGAARAAASNGGGDDARPAPRTGVIPSLLGSLGSLGRRPSRERPPPRRGDGAASEPKVVPAPGATPARGGARSAPPETGGAGSRRGRHGAPPRQATPGGGSVFAGTPTRSRKGPPLPIVLPIVVVLLALLVALFVSGVFGGDDPASSPRVGAPADAPAPNEAADDDVVPDADAASAREVEQAKARERTRAARRRAGAGARGPSRTTPAAPPPAATAPPPAAADPPPPPPPPLPPPPPPAARDRTPPSNSGGGSRKVDPGKGATGAEQIPPAEDTSTVPDLAPAPEPATSP